MKGLFAIVIFIFAAVAYGQGVYKCKTDSGGVEFSDVPCATGAPSEYVNVQPANVLDSGGLREWGERNATGRSPTRDVAPGGEVSRTQEIDSLACENAKRDYNFAVGYKFATPAEKIEKKRAYYRACGLASTGGGSTYGGAGSRQAPTSLPAPVAPKPSIVTNCDQAGCFDNLGNRYNKGAGNTYFGPNGPCQLLAGNMQCP